MKVPSNICFWRERRQLLSKNFLHIRFLLSFLLHHQLLHAIVLRIIQLKRKASLSIFLANVFKCYLLFSFTFLDLAGDAYQTER